MTDALSTAVTNYRMHALDCRTCHRLLHASDAGRAIRTVDLCSTGQRLHGTVLGLRARITTAANHGRPALRIVKDPAA